LIAQKVTIKREGRMCCDWCSAKAAVWRYCSGFLWLIICLILSASVWTNFTIFNY
jgi:hypothetical protein